MSVTSVLKLKIKGLDIAQSYFKGQVELVGKNYTLNLQERQSYSESVTPSIFNFIF